MLLVGLIRLASGTEFQAPTVPLFDK